MKRVKMEEKLLWGAYRNSPTLFRTVSHSTHMSSPSSRLGVFNLSTPLISGTGKAADFKFGGYIYRANANKSPLKILEKRERVRIQDFPNFWVPLLSQERVKLRTSNFVGTFIGSIGTKAHEKC